MSTDLPGKKDIGLALKNCNKKYQSIILLMASSGMGRAEVKHLKIKDYFTALNRPVNVGEINTILESKDNDLIGCWKVTRFKTGMPYYTFNSPESTIAVAEYLQSRPDIESEGILFPAVGKIKEYNILIIWN
jgi:hypothetical protein